jgi:hypothetical protein
MKALEVTGSIDSEGNLILDEPIRGDISCSWVLSVLNLWKNKLKTIAGLILQPLLPSERNF